jgi:hypothetical protein
MQLRSKLHLMTMSHAHSAMQRPADERAKWYKAAADEIQALIDSFLMDAKQSANGVQGQTQCGWIH